MSTYRYAARLSPSLALNHRHFLDLLFVASGCSAHAVVLEVELDNSLVARSKGGRVAHLLFPVG